MTECVVCGIYEHYKGKRYEVLGTARHSETLESLVVYRALYGEGALWVRPAAMFFEMVAYEGQKRPRFVRLDADGAGPLKKDGGLSGADGRRGGKGV